MTMRTLIIRIFNVRNICKRVVAIVLVFIFAFTNCFTLLTTVSLATAEELGKQSSDNFSKNVEYVVNFEKDGEEELNKDSFKFEEKKNYITNSLKNEQNKMSDPIKQIAENANQLELERWKVLQDTQKNALSINKI